jgi:hypothetical protein
MGAKSVCYSLAYHGWPRLESFADDGCAMGGQEAQYSKDCKPSACSKDWLHHHSL